MEHKPYIPSDSPITDFSLRAVLSGVIFGILFGTANAYLGLRVGLTISTSIPLAVISVAWFRAFEKLFGPTTILEHNISQTAGSASSSVASGLIFTVPALFLWGFNPGILQIGTLGLLGGVLGILFMIPLRRFLIVKEHGNLPYPEGTASAQVLIAADEGGARAKNVFLGLGVGAVYKALTGFLHLWPERVALKLPLVKKAVVGIEPTPALLGVGYILGYRISAIMVAGGLLSWLGLIPLIAHFGEPVLSPMFPEMSRTIAEMTPSQLWTRYIRYIGAGAVAFAGIITVIKALPTMMESLKIGLRELRESASGLAVGKVRTDSDLSIRVVIGGASLVILALIVTPHVIGTMGGIAVRVFGALSIAIFAFLFVTVSSRIVGLVGVTSNPTSGMTIVTLLGTSTVFAVLGWTDDLGKAAALTVGAVVAVSASIAGDISQDLKTGFLIGATPRRQQISELVGSASSAFFIAAAVWLLGEAFTFGSTQLPAPQATLMKTVIEGVLRADLPWGLVFVGAAFAGVTELLGVPSLPFAVGMYLPLSTMTPVFVGGCLRRWVELRSGDDKELLEKRRDQGVLLGSGLIAGEGIMGVAVALYAFFAGHAPAGIGWHWPGDFGDWVSLGIFALLGYYLLRMTRLERVG